MLKVPNNPLLGERLVSGAASTALSLGVVLVLATISSGEGDQHAARRSLTTFDLASSAQNVAAKPVADQPVAPSASMAPFLTEPGRQKVSDLGKVAASLPEDGGENLPSAQPLIQPAALTITAPQEPSLTTPVIQPMHVAPAPKPVATMRPSASMQAITGSGGALGGYKAEVWRHLLQYRRPNAVGPGSALVSFSIGDSGGVGDVGIARSSGSTRFDGEAKQMVRRAQPFPKPPPDAARSFTFEIKGN
ncbi:TonB family protein [Novosphingobium sp. Rr 2-17]|uniref:energy transducer TonB family protein n=1 Tax=Novosphingobium sp. Rr 2-17 TaxID=555793 RepID=UPI000269AADD|nr:energy transducer TonB [Novosphingobium sp. Rr 2-17]EIZ81149.1 TonB family protein [Novosphingobium sp. Rr 2-17]